MKYISRMKKWTLQDGYKRDVLLSFGNEKYPNIQIQLTQIAAHEKVGSHFHAKQTEFIFFLKGLCDYIFEKATVTMHPGDLLIIDPGESHSTINNYDKTSEFLTLKVNGSTDDTIWE